VHYLHPYLCYYKTLLPPQKVVAILTVSAIESKLFNKPRVPISNLKVPAVFPGHPLVEELTSSFKVLVLQMSHKQTPLHSLHMISSQQVEPRQEFLPQDSQKMMLSCQTHPLVHLFTEFQHHILCWEFPRKTLDFTLP
jgi:hypothetical protein